MSEDRPTHWLHRDLTGWRLWAMRAVVTVLMFSPIWVPEVF